MKLPLLSLRRLAASLAFAAALAAHAATSSDPVGALRLRLRGNSDTLVSLPLHRPALREALVVSRTGSQLTLPSAAPTLPTGGAYALVMSGPLEGAVLPITTASGSTLTVDGTGFDLTTLRTGTDLVSIIPYWTLDTLFPGGQGIHISTDAADRKTEVLWFNDATVGTNRSASATYFYHPGAEGITAGWYQTGNVTPKGSVQLPPDHYFIVRHKIATDTELVVTGAVRMAGFRVQVGTKAANRDQDNLVALPVPVSVALSDSRLVESGAFTASPDGAARRDELLIYNNATIGFNKSASAVYFYMAGNPDVTTGWYKVGDPTPANSVQLKAGEGYIIRKKAEAVPTARQWSAVPSYLQ